MAKQQISMRVICVDPIRVCLDYDMLRFGLQDKKQQLQEGQPLSDDELAFDFELMVQRQSDDSANFTGAVAHGTRDKRFVYLTYMGKDGDSWQIFRRIKIPLWMISWQDVETALARGHALQARVSGLSSGTVPLLDGGWLPADV